jgi:hypothetical protein
MKKKRWILFCLALACVPAVAVLAFVLRDVWSNSAALRGFDRQFSTLSHPANTRFIARRKCVGLLCGGGNHCGFFVGELRAFSGEWDEAAKAYADRTIIGPIDDELVPVRALRASAAFTGRERLPWDLATLEGWEADGPDEAEQLYIVYVFPSCPANLDPRCH